MPETVERTKPHSTLERPLLIACQSCGKDITAHVMVGQIGPNQLLVMLPGRCPKCQVPMFHQNLSPIVVPGRAN